MDYKDLIVTPLLLIIIYLIALQFRHKVTDRFTRQYFIIGLSLKIAGAIALGLIYQFYYDGGDTFTYFNDGSRYIWEAFQDSPLKAFQLIFARGDYYPETIEYASKILYYEDLPSYFVVRVAGFLDIITFHTYSATAILFAVISFSGLWALYITFYRIYPKLYNEIAIAIFFIPSVFFWGSGILKDPITLGALGWATFAYYRMVFERKEILSSALIFITALLVIYQIKIYILLCFVPALLIWTYFYFMKNVKNLVVKAMVFPFSFLILVAGGYTAVREISEENKQYSLGRITETAETTARWLTFVSMREGGSGYTLGDFDYSMEGIVRKSPAAIWVTLFRPYLWEAKNSVMFLSAIESFAFLVFTVFVFFVAIIRGSIRQLFLHPLIVFCFSFAVSFSFAVGISTYNFGSLVRYKIPMMPFYLIGLFVLYYYSKNRKKTLRLAVREKRSSTSR